MAILKTLVTLFVIVIFSCLLDVGYIAKQVTSKENLPFKVKILPQYGV